MRFVWVSLFSEAGAKREDPCSNSAFREVGEVIKTGGGEKCNYKIQ